MPINRSQLSTPSVAVSSSSNVRTPAKPAATATPAAAASAGWGAKNGVKLPGASASIAEVGLIAAKAKEGTLNPQMVEARLAKLPAISNSESQTLWTAPGASKRGEMIAAYSELAKSAPNARMPANPVNGYRATVKESLLQLQFTDAQAKKDSTGMKKFAGEMVKQFPNSPQTTWMKNLAGA